MPRDLDTVVRAYVECAIWADKPEEYIQKDVEPSLEFVRAARRDCKGFIELLEREGVDSSEWDDSQFGYDFWLTRQHHGAGFWDRGKKNGDVLTKWAQTYGSVDTYVTRRGRFTFM